MSAAPERSRLAVGGTRTRVPQAGPGGASESVERLLVGFLDRVRAGERSGSRS